MRPSLHHFATGSFQGFVVNRLYPTRRAVIATGAAAAALAGCEQALARKTSEYGFRLEMALIVAGRQINVESVRKVVSWEHYSWVPTSNQSYSNCFGDAAPVDIGQRTLFVTRAGYRQFGEGPREPTDLWTPQSVYRLRGNGAPPRWTEPRRGLALNLAPEELPVMVTFADLDDPQSIRIVRPDELSDLFPGVRLGRCKVEWTRDRPTRTDVRQRLPWAYDDRRKPEIYPYVYADKHLFGI